jgi:hypothetical protein
LEEGRKEIPINIGATVLRTLISKNIMDSSSSSVAETTLSPTPKCSCGLTERRTVGVTPIQRPATADEIRENRRTLKAAIDTVTALAKMREQFKRRSEMRGVKGNNLSVLIVMINHSRKMRT